MQSPFSFVKVLGFLLINILVSAITTWVVVRTLVPPLAQATSLVASAPSAPATTNATQDSALFSKSPSGTSAPDPNATTIPNAPVNANAAATPHPTPTLLKAGTKSTVNVRISSVIYPGQLSREVIVMVNEGEQVDMTGWQMVPVRGTPYVFGQVVVFKNSFVNLHTTTGADVPTDLFWGLGEPMWQSGDELKLLRKDGSVASTFTVK